MDMLTSSFAEHQSFQTYSGKEYVLSKTGDCPCSWPWLFREFEKGCDETHVNLGSALKIAESESESNIEESDSDMDIRRREAKNNTLE